MEKVRSMLVQSQLRKNLWAETLLTTCYHVNLSPSAVLEFKTPFEIWHEKPANYDNLKVFGCPTYAYVNQRKLALRALKGQFIGYPEGVKGFKLWCTDLNPPRCKISMDVVFNEKATLDIKKPYDKDAQKDGNKTKVYFEVEPFSKETSRDEDDTDHGFDNREDDQERQTEA